MPSLLDRTWKWQSPVQTIIELNADWLNLIWALIDSEFYLSSDCLNVWADCITFRVSMFPRQWRVMEEVGMGQEEKRQYKVYWTMNQTWKWQIPVKSEIDLNDDWLNLICTQIYSEFYFRFNWISEWADRITPMVSMIPRQWDGSGMG